MFKSLDRPVTEGRKRRTTTASRARIAKTGGTDLDPGTDLDLVTATGIGIDEIETEDEIVDVVIEVDRGTGRGTEGIGVAVAIDQGPGIVHDRGIGIPSVIQLGSVERTPTTTITTTWCAWASFTRTSL